MKKFHKSRVIVNIQSDREFLSSESVNSELRLMERPDIPKVYLSLQESAQSKYIAKRLLMSLG